MSQSTKKPKFNIIKSDSEPVPPSPEENIKRNLDDCIKWTKTKPDEPKKTKDKTIEQQKREEKEKEKKWGNSMICQTNNGQWTTKLGELLVFIILQLRGENPRKVKRKNGLQPDWETDNYIYEVKTSNWCVGGTAGEKVLGTWIKYQDVPEIYGKPLRIVCVANQEYELEFGKTPFFGEKVTEKTKKILELAKLWNIEYMRFSDLINYK